MAKIDDSDWLDAILATMLQRMSRTDQVVMWMLQRGAKPAVPCVCGHGLIDHDERGECLFPRSIGAPAVLCPCTDFKTLESDP